eukprot:370325_1
MSQLRRLKKILQKRKWVVALSSVFALLCGRFIANKIHRKIYKLPPGPEGLPFFGYTINNIFSKDWHIFVANTYGPIAYLKTIRGKSVLISSSKIAKDLLSTPAMDDRETKYTHQINLAKGKDGSQPFVTYNGNEWKQGRRLMHSKLIRMLNTQFVNDIFIQSIKNEFEPFLNNIISTKNGIWYPRQMATQLTFNTIFKANFGQTFDKNNQLHIDLLAGTNQLLSPKVGFKSAMLVICPFLKYITCFKREINNILETNHNNVIKLLSNYERKTEKDKMSFIDYNIELRENEKICEGRVVADILLTFLAGTDTTALSFGIILLAKQPKIQERVRHELLQYKLIKKKDIVYDINVLLMVPCFRALLHEIL